jgi:hypothetical protein
VYTRYRSSLFFSVQKEKMTRALERARQGMENARARAEDSEMKELNWSDAFCELERQTSLFGGRYEEEEMTSWGQNGKPFPWEMVMLAQSLMVDDVAASRVPEVIKECLTACLPHLALDRVQLPSAQTCRQWRLGVQFLSDVVAALKIAASASVTLHQDLASARQLQYGCAVLRTDKGECLAVHGVLLQGDGTARTSAGKVVMALKELECAVEVVRQGLKSRNLDSSFLPSATQSLLNCLVRGDFGLFTQQDHCTTATKTNDMFNEGLRDMAGERGYDPDHVRATTNAQCHDHKVGSAHT